MMISNYTVKKLANKKLKPMSFLTASGLRNLFVGFVVVVLVLVSILPLMS